MKLALGARRIALGLLMATAGLLAGCDYVAQLGDSSLHASISAPEAKRFLEDVERSGVLSRQDVQSVGLKRSGDTVVVEVWLKETANLDTRRIEELQRMSSRLTEEAFDGAPVEVRLMDSQGRLFQRIIPHGAEPTRQPPPGTGR